MLMGTRRLYRFADRNPSIHLTAPPRTPTMRWCSAQRYCSGFARCWRALRLSADRPGKAARKPARKAGVLDHEDKVPRETDSPLEEAGNPRSPRGNDARRIGFIKRAPVCC